MLLSTLLSKSDNLIVRGLNILRLETLEPPLDDEDVSDQGVQLVDRVLVLIAYPGKADPHPEVDPNTWAQMALLSLVSILTSLVPICLYPNFLISCRKKL